MELSHIVAELSTADLQSLAHYRHRSDWQIAIETPKTCLLKAPATESNSADFQSLPCLRRWNLSENKHLVPKGKTLPTKFLPALAWQDISTVLPVLPTVSKNSESYFGHVSLHLVRSKEWHEPCALLVDTKYFSTWADTAAEQRLARLEFACSSHDMTLISGTPLPPIEGESFYKLGQIMIPSGYALPDYIHHLQVSESLKLRAGQTALLYREETHIIDLEQFVTGSRTAARLSTLTKQ